MVFLARFILKGPNQAALVAATMAILGILLAPAVWVSAAAIALVTLVKDYRQGMRVMVFAAVGCALFAWLIFSSPLVVVYFVLMAWLPAWLAATVLKQTVSLAASLQLITALSLLAVIVLYVVFPGFGEFWREPLDLLVQQLAEEYQGQLSLEELQQAEELAIKLIPGLIASSILFGTMISLFLARWWQAVVLNPGGFGKEFQSLNLGKGSAMIAAAIATAAIVVGTEPVYAMLLLVVALYITQGMSVVHAVFARKKLNSVWLYAFYIAMFFVPHIVALLVMVGITDAWIDFRRRLVA
jgi:hypothetical protein